MMLEDWTRPFLDIAIDGRLGLVIAAIALAGFIRGFVGFGAALIIVPVLSLTYGPHIAIPALTVMGLPSTLQLLPDAIRHSERSVVLPMTLAIFLALPLGTWVLVSVDPNLMKIVISALVVLMVAFLANGGQLTEKVSRSILLFAGAAGGLVQGAAGMGGPPVVAIALARSGTPEQQRGNVLAVIAALLFASVPSLFYFDLLTPEAVAYGLILLPPNLLATWIGSRFFSGAGRDHFRNVALIVLAIIGLTTFAVAVWDVVGQSA